MGPPAIRKKRAIQMQRQKTKEEEKERKEAEKEEERQRKEALKREKEEKKKEKEEMKKEKKGTKKGGEDGNIATPATYSLASGSRANSVDDFHRMSEVSLTSGIRRVKTPPAIRKKRAI